MAKPAINGNRVKEKAQPIRLCQFLSDEALSPLACIQRTARYADDPTEYLNNTIGKVAVGERRTQLCIADEIDRDFYGVGAHKQHFEQHIANLLGKTHGLFFITGVQAQLIAMNIHCEAVGNFRVAWHVSSHLESAEEAYKTLYGLHRILLGDDPAENPSVDDIKKVLSRREACRPAAILLEIPNRALGCKTYTFEELQTISQECRKANVRLHCDGARLWEIEPYYQATAGKSFQDIGALFDSIYVSFYKGLQASSGAILAGDEEMMTLAKKWQRRAGGNIFTMQYQIIDAERGFNENIGSFAARRKKMVEIANGIRKATSKYQHFDGLSYLRFLPDQPTCCQTHTIFQGFSAEELTQARDVVQQKTNIRVFEKLRSKQTVDELLKQARAAQVSNELSNAIAKSEVATTDMTQVVEWMIVDASQRLDHGIFVDAYVALCEELHALLAVREAN